MAKPDDILATFGYCTRALIELLHENPRLEPVNEMFIESHLALVKTAFDGWKRRNNSTAK